MTNMEKICKAPLNKENDINWQEINHNNNAVGRDCKDEKACQAMKPNDQFPAKHECLVNHIENAGASNTISDVMNESFNKVALLTPNSNCSSTNNSTDNLSFISDSCAIEEVLVVPNTISDEEISVNSDDCIYAYRGADYELPEPRIIPPDDETDYLEMDFDPDPLSEVDQTIELNAHLDNSACDYTEDKCCRVESFEVDLHTENASPNVATSMNETVNLKNGHRSPEMSSENIQRHTGAKPKKFVNPDKIAKISKANKIDEVYNFVINPSENIDEHREIDETCLDCLEKEFLSKTIGKEMEPISCSVCKCSTNRQQYNHSTPFKTTGFHDVALAKSEDEGMHRNYQRKSGLRDVETSILLKSTECVRLLSTEVDERSIVQALERINIECDVSVLTNFFNFRKRDFDNVPELIKYISKRNCDYKRFIKIIKSATSTELDINFTKDEDLPRCFVQVSAIDILECWAQSNDLNQLKRMGVIFSQANVLGKVINLIRQAQQGKLNVLDEFILIPQYYEVGYITIKRK